MTKITLEIKDNIIRIILEDCAIKETKEAVKTEINCGFCEFPCGNAWCGGK